MRKEHLLQEMTDIVKSCEDILLSATDMERKIHRKTGKGNFVTDYDSKVQAILQSRLLELLPEAVFLGEEDQMDSTDISKGYAFIVDPIDGTANFTRNYHASCISVALALDGFPILGVVHNPYQKETFTALKGQGAYLNGERIHASDRTLDEGLILFGTAPYHADLTRKSFEIAYRYLSRAEDLRRSGSAALDLCMVACGRAEFFFELTLCPWDYAAGALIVEEAGGFVSDLKGRPLTYDRRQTVAARGPRVELVEVEIS
ncbi:MAG: inositol monophosphatase [Lachnospiraceae bacterium]|nr:inositol monophosphatase [Lachnospiraceae bacterium]